MVKTLKHPESEYYTTFEEMRDAYIRIIQNIPGLHLKHKIVCDTAASFANVCTHGTDYRRYGRLNKDSKPFQLARTIAEIETALAEVQPTRQICFEILKKTPDNITRSASGLASNLLALTDIYDAYPEIAAPRDAFSIKDRSSAFRSVCSSSGLQAASCAAAYVAKCRRYIELIDKGHIRHEHFIVGKKYVLSIFRMPIHELDKRLAECDARLARGEKLPPLAKEEVVKRRAKSVPRPKATAVRTVTRPVGTDNASKEGQQTLAAKLLAMRAAKNTL